MSAETEKRMTVDEFLVWAQSSPGRWELYNGVPYAMAPERAQHAVVKHRVARALENGIARAGCACHMLPDGMTVRVSETAAHEPDALVYCGPRLPPDAIEVPRPVIVVDVLSPSTRCIDASAKLTGYFSLPSVHHYLIIDPDSLPIIHHQRQADGTILTRLLHGGMIRLDPPGIELGVSEIGAGQ